MSLVEIEFSPSSWSDPETGRKVTRLFPTGQPASHAYFTSTSFDGQGDLILSVEIEGKWQLCRVDLSAGKAWRITELENMRPQGYCVCPKADFALVIDHDEVVRVNLSSGEIDRLFKCPEGWRISIPTVDAAGSRAAFAISEKSFGFTASDRIYSTMAETYFFRPRSMICCIDFPDHSVSVAWGEVAWISHVLISPTDRDTIVFCHEGGHRPQHRLWVVDAPDRHKKTARCLYEERFEEFLVHEYFVADGTVGVQRSWYDLGSPRDVRGPYDHNSILFITTEGQTVAEYHLPGARSGHVQSNSDNTLIVADGCFVGDPKQDADGRKYLALNIPDGRNARVEKLCRHDTSWKTQLSHPHPIFSPDDRRILFSSDTGGSNSPFLVEL